MNMITDDEMNTNDKESAMNYFHNNEQPNGQDIKAAHRVMPDRDMMQMGGDDGPKMARNMGFPDMKYLDPETHGDPIQEKTLYKEYIGNKDNDIR